MFNTNVKKGHFEIYRTQYSSLDFLGMQLYFGLNLQTNW